MGFTVYGLELTESSVVPGLWGVLDDPESTDNKRCLPADLEQRIFGEIWALTESEKEFGKTFGRHRIIFRTHPDGIKPRPLPAGSTTAAVVKELEAVFFDGNEASQVVVNGYVPGTGIGKHSDAKRTKSDKIVSISLGSDCVMEMEKGNTVIPVVLRRGAVCVLTGDALNIWTHAIAATKVDHVPGSDEVIQRQKRVSVVLRDCY